MLGLCKRQVQYLLRALIDHGLIVPVDSPTGRRWGRRHPVTGKIVGNRPVRTAVVAG